MLNSTFRPSADMFPELGRLQGFLEQVLSPAGRGSIRALAGAAFPTINVGNTPGTVEVMATVPGVDPAQLQLTIERGVLVIAGERRGAADGAEGVSVYAQERFSGPFRRVVSLPDEVDSSKVDATYRDGILRVTLHKRESSRPRQVRIS
jgi:HSP20 family protein